ncbi:MAG: NAD(P)H-dependent oxidoreductase [Chloroflexota bacterium]|nr:NAD(P)H-dependent oxidoreductase [Chloroflexota bacterium]
MALNTVVFYGSVRSERQGIKAAKFVVNTLKARGHDVKLIDPLEYKLPLLDWMYKEYEAGKAPEPLETLAGMIRNADAFVVVSGEYNHSIPPPLTNLMDHFLEEYFFRPSGIVCYSGGMFGGVRAAMQLRAFLAEIGTVTIPTLFPIPRVQDAFTEEGEPLNPKTHEFIQQFLNELEWYAVALKEARAKRALPY